MSFANIDLEAQSPDPGTPTNELDSIIANTSRQLQNFGSLIGQFDHQRKHLGVKRDTAQLRASLDTEKTRLSELDGSIRVLVDSISATLNRSSAGDKKIDVTNRQMVIKERLVTEYNELHRRYVRSVKAYVDKKKSLPPPANEQTPLLVERASEPSPPQQQQQQQQLVDQDLIDETELQYHALLTEERNREISQATEGILEVNQIFKNLGELVHQQGEQLDTVEDNIAKLHSNTHQASRELNKAHEYQKRKGKWSCILLVALCIFVLIMVLAVVS